MQAKVGDKIRIIKLTMAFQPKEYEGKEGFVTKIGLLQELYGTWGPVMITPIDEYIIL